jgi:nucleoside 2-deoxyribosyltransferase
MNKKIYFAGSIRGGRQDAEVYKKIIEYIQKTDIVLTEHIGNASLNVKERSRDKDQEIYDQDTGWLRESDMVIAECTNTSLGVGYELGYAESRGIPCHIFYRKSMTQLSAMLNGNPYFDIHPYEDMQEFFCVLDEILNQ